MQGLFCHGPYLELPKRGGKELPPKRKKKKRLAFSMDLGKQLAFI
jgi:hypothetical protein